MSTSILRAVVFDLDGLMFNTEELYEQVDTEVLARRGKPCEEALLDQMTGRKADVALQMMIDWHDLDDTIEQLSAEISALFAEVLPQRLAPMPGLMRLLDALEVAQIPKGIATSSGPAFVSDVLNRFQLQPRFSFVLTSEDIQHGKPAPDIYRLAAERHGLPTEQVMVLEDSLAGCQAAVAAGAYAVAVPHGRSLKFDFPGANLIADTLDDPRIGAALGLPRQPAETD